MKLLNKQVPIDDVYNIEITNKELRTIVNRLEYSRMLRCEREITQEEIELREILNNCY